nr:hypothetical protein [Paenibacillus sp. Soil750]
MAIITGGDSGIGRAIALSLIKRGIHINAGSYCRTWTPLIPASLSIKDFDHDSCSDLMM